jgi:hypothetical protein
MANCRLFANKNVQYYGKESDYKASMLTSGETNTFAGYSPSSAGKMTLHPMSVMVTLEEGENLKLGIRTSNFKADGTRSDNDSHGWFKVDHFRLQRIDAEEIPSKIHLMDNGKWEMNDETGNGKWSNDQCFDLQGRMVNDQWLNGKLPSGVYIQNGKKVVVK